MYDARYERYVGPGLTKASEQVYLWDTARGPTGTTCMAFSSTLQGNIRQLDHCSGFRFVLPIHSMHGGVFKCTTRNVAIGHLCRMACRSAGSGQKHMMVGSLALFFVCLWFASLCASVHPYSRSDAMPAAHASSNSLRPASRKGSQQR